MSEGRDQHDVGIARVDDDRSDVARVFQSDIVPGPAGVGRFVNAVAVRDVAAQTGFAAARIKNVGVGVGHRDGADRRDALVIERRSPSQAAVGALENSSGNRAEVIGVGIAGNSGDGEHAAAAKRSDLPPLHAADNGRIDLRTDHFRQNEHSSTTASAIQRRIIKVRPRATRSRVIVMGKRETMRKANA